MCRFNVTTYISLMSAIALNVMMFVCSILSPFPSVTDVLPSNLFILRPVSFTGRHTPYIFSSPLLHNQYLLIISIIITIITITIITPTASSL